jgi:hypothetical protein
MRSILVLLFFFFQFTSVSGAGITAENEFFEKEFKDPVLHPKYWIALIPGNSEEWGHHHAPPVSLDPNGKLISSVFMNRLEIGYQLLDAGVTRFLFISGGVIDTSRPDYSESKRGKQYLLDKYGRLYKPGKLAEKIILDEVAGTTVANIHNADQFCVRHGLHEYIIATELVAFIHPVTHRLSPPQGKFLLSSTSFPINLRTWFILGYSLGSNEEISLQTKVTPSQKVLLHHIINDEKLNKGEFIH